MQTVPRGESRILRTLSRMTALVPMMSLHPLASLPESPIHVDELQDPTRWGGAKWKRRRTSFLQTNRESPSRIVRRKSLAVLLG